jgi:hypothetical protein
MVLLSPGLFSLSINRPGFSNGKPDTLLRFKNPIQINRLQRFIRRRILAAVTTLVAQRPLLTHNGLFGGDLHSRP